MAKRAPAINREVGSSQPEDATQPYNTTPNLPPQAEASSVHSGDGGFNGLRVLAFESRHSAMMRALLERANGDATVVPVMQETALDAHPSQTQFHSELLQGNVGVCLFTTGIGVRIMTRQLDALSDRSIWLPALSKTAIVARGSKTIVALRALRVPIALTAPAPHTWREAMSIIQSNPQRVVLKGQRVVLQETGTPNRALARALTSKGADLLRLSVYRWSLPEDIAPILTAINNIIEGTFDVVLFTNGTQAWHLFKVAYKNNIEDELRAGLQRAVVASIGPSCTEALIEFEVTPHIESPSLHLSDFIEYVSAFAPQLRRPEP